MTTDPGPIEVRGGKRSTIPGIDIADDQLRERLLRHIRDGCYCTTSQYTDVPAKMAEHQASGSSRVTRFVDRIKDMLFALRHEKAILLEVRSGGISAARMAPPLPDPAPAGNPKGGGTMAKPTQEPAAEAGAVSDAHWPPLLSAYRDLILFWLLENGGEIEDPSGRLSTQLRERFGIIAGETVRKHISTVLFRLETEGTIERQRTTDPAERTSNIKKWTDSRRTYKITLIPSLPGGLEALRAQMEKSQAMVLHAIQAAGKAADSTPNDPEDEVAGVDEPEEETPLHDVLMANRELREQLADRELRPIRRAWHALRAEADKKGTPTKGSWFAIDGAGTLREARFSDQKAAEVRWYLNLLGTGPKPKGQSRGNKWWWSVTKDEPTPRAVNKIIIEQRKIYDPAERGGHDDSAPIRFPGQVRGVPATLGDHRVGDVRLGSVSGPPSPATVAAVVGTKPAPPAAAAAAKSAPAPVAISGIDPGALIEQLTGVIEDLEKQLGQEAEEAAAKIKALKAEVEALTRSNANHLAAIEKLSADHRAVNRQLEERATQMRNRIAELEQQTAMLAAPGVAKALELLARHPRPATPGSTSD